jgi:hypothetical protein
MAADLPDSLQINAWTGAGAASPLASTWTAWATTQHMANANRTMAAGEPVDERDWHDPRVGWGLVVRDPDGSELSNADRAEGLDLPEPLRQLVRARSGPILRYREDVGLEFLRRYYPDGTAQDLSISGSKPGTGRGQLPMYLLLWGSPAEGGSPPWIPWRFQYVLNCARYVGRLHLEGEPLENYVSALMSDWSGSQVRADRPVVWAVDHDANDITHLMRQVVAEPVVKALRNDNQVGQQVRYFSEAGATNAALIDALADSAHRAAFIVTTSHGMTGPLNDPPAMAAALGLLVDQHQAALKPDDLLGAWAPDGAIWYSHACCSAGADDVTQYGELVPDGAVKDVLVGVAALGASVAPMPTRLLGAKRPLRAFVGHVEPTFDWTLRHKENKQPLTTALQQTLYDGMYRARPEPVGLAFKRVFAHVGQLFAQYHLAKQRTLAIDPDVRLRARAAALRTQLGALDRQACVILGDPTVALPPLA